MKRSLYLFSFFTTPLFAQGPSAADVAQSTVAEATKTEAPVTVFSLIQSGGWAMIPLVLMSIATVALALVFLFTLRRRSIVTAHYMHTAEGLLKKGDFTALLSISERHGEAIARVVGRMLEFATQNPAATFEVVREVANTEGAAIAASFQNRISYLADIAVLSPMVGLLGTVFGIIHSFGVLASNVSEASRPVLLAEGVSEALVATGAGLVVGIVSMALYGFFRNRVQHLISDLERASAHTLGLMAGHFSGGAPATQGGRRSAERGNGGTSGGGIRRSGVSLDDEF